MIDFKYYKICKKCGATRFFKNKNSFKYNKKEICFKCSMNSEEYKHKQKISKLGNKNGMYGKTHSIKTRKKLSEYLKQRMKNSINIEKLKNRQWTEEQIKKHKLSINNPKRLEILRKHRLNQIKKSGGIASFNELACKYFNIINKKLNLKGYHALNGGEKEIIGYSLDYYDPELKLIIE